MRGSTSICSSGLSECPIVNKKSPFTEVKSPFRGQNDSSFILDKKFLIFHIYRLKYSYHVFRICVLWLMRCNDVYTIKWERWSWKQEIRQNVYNVLRRNFWWNTNQKLPLFHEFDFLRLCSHQCNNFHCSGLFWAIIYIPLMGTSER